MGKTLLRSSASKDSNQIKVTTAEENTDLDQLTEELQPYLDIASKQLLKPDAEILSDLLRKISG